VSEQILEEITTVRSGEDLPPNKMDGKLFDTSFFV
jgi:hypothetical protein